MKRVLVAAGMALAFHAGLFWWGRDWGWDAASTPGTKPSPINLELTVFSGPVQTGEPAVTTASESTVPEGKPEAPAERQRTPRRQVSEPPPPKIDAAPAPSETAQALPPSTPEIENREHAFGEEVPQPRADAEPVTQPTAKKPGLAESSAGNSAISPGPQSSPARGGADPGPEGPRNRHPEEASGANAGVIAAQPLYRLNPPPSYPLAARQRQDEGTVLLDVLVDEKGRVGELRIATSSGHPLLDRAALKGVRRWRFEPGRRDQEKIPMWVQVPIRFTLQ